MKFKAMAAALAAFAGMATAAEAATVATLTDLNIRSGPGTGYAPITKLPQGTRLELGDCTKDLNWCRVYWRGAEGWASSHYLSEPGAATAPRPRVAEERRVVREPRVVEVYRERVIRRPAYRDYSEEGDILIGPADGYGDDEGYEARPRIYLRFGAGGVSYGPRGYYRRQHELHLD